MSVAQFIRDGLRQLHGSYNDMLKDLTPDQLHWCANERGVPIAFVAWHYVRTEDNVVQYVLQRKPTVWLEGGWNEKFGLDRIAQGTGMPLEEARALRLPSAEAFLEYAEGVWQATDSFLAGIDDAYLEQRTTVKPLGEMPVRNVLGNMCLTHGCTHLGEIQHLRGLLGLRGAPI
ncbi:MAG: DinB family protein [Chloroflexi bacterium]|nr:DinB family protein [Chloroflexota bacterium]